MYTILLSFTTLGLYLARENDWMKVPGWLLIALAVGLGLLIISKIVLTAKDNNIKNKYNDNLNRVKSEIDKINKHVKE